MSGIALRSILHNSKAKIYIGYINDADLADLPSDPRITFLNLATFANFDSSIDSSNSYSDYLTSEFYGIVALKWLLFKKIFELTQLNFFLYVDLDVIWCADAYDYIFQTFSKFPHIDVIIQDASDKLFEPALCMGVVALRKSEFTHSLIQECSKIHRHILMTDPKVGDDTVITSFFEYPNNREKFFLLPQKAFPVGNMANTYSRIGVFPGLKPPSPYIFHANYVVGIRKKVLLMFSVGRELNMLEHFEITLGKRLLYSSELTLRQMKFRAVRIFNSSKRAFKGAK